MRPALTKRKEDMMSTNEQPDQTILHAPASVAWSGVAPPLPFEPARTFHIPHHAVPIYRREFSREPDGESDSGAYVILTVEAFERAFPDLRAAQHVCRVFSDQDLKIAHHDTHSVRTQRERILAAYREETGTDPPWAAQMDNDDIDFQTADRLVALLSLLTTPDGRWAPDYRGKTIQELAVQVMLEEPPTDDEAHRENVNQ